MGTGKPTGVRSRVQEVPRRSPVTDSAPAGFWGQREAGVQRAGWNVGPEDSAVGFETGAGGFGLGPERPKRSLAASEWCPKRWWAATVQNVGAAHQQRRRNAAQRDGGPVASCVGLESAPAVPPEREGRPNRKWFGDLTSTPGIGTPLDETWRWDGGRADEG